MSINDAILDSSSPLIWLLHKWLQVRFSVAAAVFQEAQNKNTLMVEIFVWELEVV